MASLESDDHSEKIYQALVFGKVRLQSKAIALTDQYLTLTIWRVNVEPSPVNWNAITMAIDATAKEQGVFEVPFVLEVMPGDYDLRSIGLRPSLDSEERLYFHPKKNGAMVAGKNPQHQFRVTPNSLTYLGTIDIQLLESHSPDVSAEKGTKDYPYTLAFNNGFAQDVHLLKNEYPNLYNTYRKNLILVF